MTRTCRPVTGDEIAAVQALAAARLTQTQAARAMGTTRGRISYVTRLHGIWWPVKWRRATP